MLMGSKRNWLNIWVMFCIYLSRFVEGLNSYNPDSLDDFVQDYAYNTLVRPRTGILYNLSLPANFSGMEVSVVRVRTRSFWLRGANSSSFHIPPRVLPMPFVRRFYMIYKNLGNWSSYYYNMPNYTLVTPVVGFMVYNATNPTSGRNAKLNFRVDGDPILVHFPQISLPEEKNVTIRCVRFGVDGLVELSNVTVPNVCITRDHGHFAIVAPSPPSLSRKKRSFWKWWEVGFGVGIVGLVLVALLVIVIYKFVKRKRIEKMVKESERSEPLETMWVGMSKMPSAAGIRTQPELEDDQVP